jgi:hypothetical protein
LDKSTVFWTQMLLWISLQIGNIAVSMRLKFTVDVTTIKKGLKSPHKGFEDVLQIICAYSIDKMDALVTRNIKDFRQSEIPVFTPEELVMQFM